MSTLIFCRLRSLLCHYNECRTMDIKKVMAFIGKPLTMTASRRQRILRFLRKLPTRKRNITK